MISFLWKGCSAILLRVQDLNLLMDPGDHFTIDELRSITERIDAVFYTHEHTGHFDPDFLSSLIREFSPYMIVNKGVFRTIRRWVDWDRLIKLKEGESTEVLGMRVHALRAVHPGVHPVVFLLEIGGKAIFHGDSTGFSHMFEAFSPVDLAFVPSGSPSPNANPKEAVRIIRALVPRVVVPFHGDSSELQEVERRVRLANLNTKVILPEPGELFTLEI